MKRLLLLITLIFAINDAFSADITIQGVKYYIFAGVAEVEGFTSEITDIVIIPDEVTSNGVNYKVTKIGYGAFKDCTSLASIQIPNSVTEIGGSAFKGCISLASMQIPNSVIRIESRAFEGCTLLTSIQIPNSVTEIEVDAFKNCTSLTFVNFSDGEKNLQMSSFVFNDTPLKKLYLGRNISYPIQSYSPTYSPFSSNETLNEIIIGSLVTSIKTNIFSGCSALSSIILSENLNEIGTGAFSGCTSLASINLPSSVTKIGGSAFSGCTMLESIEIPRRVGSIGSFCFSGCTSLNNFQIEDGEQPLYMDTKYGALFTNCPIKDVYIGRNLSYGVHSPWQYEKINTIGIGSKVTVLDGSIFEGCSSIESVKIFDCETPLSITGNISLFKDCTLNEIYLGRDLSYSSTTSPLKNQKDLAKVTFGDRVTIIGNSAFDGCNSLDSIGLPNSISTIGRCAFSNCASLSHIEIPSTTIEIGESAFDGCTTLSSVTFVESDSPLKLLGKESLFKDCPLEKILLGRNIEYENNSPFANQAKLTDVYIGDKVTILGNYLFRNCTALKSLIIPNSVTEMGNVSFGGCTSLSSIKISNSVKKIGGGTFSNCSSLKLIEIPMGVIELEGSTFENCTSLTSFKIPDSVAKIGRWCFKGCTSLNSITIPNSVTHIKESAYAECRSLSYIYFIDGDTSLTIDGNNSLFYNCPIDEVYLGRNLSYYFPPFANQQNLTKVTLGNSVNEIGNNAFEGCTNLKELNIRADADICSNAFEDSVLRNANLIVCENKDLVLRIADSEWSQFSKIYYEDGTKRYYPIIWTEKFECSTAYYSDINGCLISVDCEDVNIRIDSDSAITTIFRGMNISETLKSEDGFCFIPNDLWRSNIFETFKNGNTNTSRNIAISSAGQLFNELGMNNLQTIESLTVSGDLNGTDIMTINRMTSLKHLDLTNANIVEGGVTYHENLKTQNNIFGEYFFRDMNSLLTILMPNSIREIQSYSVNSSIHNVVLPNDVIIIGDYAFSDCASLVSIVLPNSIESIGAAAFSGCASLQSLYIPRSVIVIGDSAFSGCSHISSVILADGKDTLDIKGDLPLFADCPLSDVYLGRDLSYNWISNFHSNSPFKQQKELTKVTFGNNITSIGKCAFENCTALSHIEIPNCVKIIDDGAFRGCSALSSIKIPNSVTTLGDYVFDKCVALESIDLPNSIGEIGNYAFSDCKSLKSIEIPNGVTAISRSTFQGCTTLNSVELPNSILYICDDAFNYCSSLRTINLGNNIIQIRRYAFSNCIALESIEIPNSVEKIEKDVFNGCTSLSSLVLKDGEKLLYIEGDNTPFSDCPLKEAYLGRNTSFKTFSNSLFKNQKELCKVTVGAYVSKIMDYTFNKCTTLHTIEIPNGVSEIGIRAFDDCTSLSKLSIGDYVEIIGDYAFGNCTALESVEIPNSVTEIGWGAFYGCSNLSSVLLGNSISKIGYKSFSGCSALKKVVSLNPTPPAIEESTFDGVDKENCQLVVTKGNLVYYWLDPYWREFVNISDDLLALNPLPSVKYGDAPVNLAEYAPEGVSLSYESSDNKVARIDGTMLTICGAGEATVSASVAEDGTPMEIIGQMRTFKVDKADLTITAQSYEINQGDPLPDFTAIYDGFVYDDNAESLQKSPTIVCPATDTSVEGVYDICVYDAEDPNYNINYVDGQLTIKAPDALPSIYDKSNVSCVAHNGQILISGLGQSQGVNIYDVNGNICYEGKAHENGILTYRPNKLGVYIVKYGQYTAKVIVR